MASVYSREIRETYQCEECAQAPARWESLGRCRKRDDGVEAYSVPVILTDRVSSHEYEAHFDTCPMALIRDDLAGDALVTAAVVSQAHYAGAKSRWPDVPAKLWALMSLLDGQTASRDAQYQRAAMESK